MYCVNWNQEQEPIALGFTSLDRFYNFPLMEENFITDFLGTVKAVKLKLGLHMDNGLIYCVYHNQGQGPITIGITSIDRLNNLPLMNNFHHTFLKNCKGYKVETWYTHGQWVDVSCVYLNRARGPKLLKVNPMIGFTICHK